LCNYKENDKKKQGRLALEGLRDNKESRPTINWRAAIGLRADGG
jgi:hypothetical protein